MHITTELGKVIALNSFPMRGIAYYQLLFVLAGKESSNCWWSGKSNIVIIKMFRFISVFLSIYLFPLV